MRPGKPATRPRSTASAPQPDHRIDDGHRAAQIVGTDRPTDPWATVGRRRHDAARRRTRAICAMSRWRSARRRARAPSSAARPRSVRQCERIAHAAARRGECHRVGLDGRAARSVAATFSGRSARPTCSTRPSSCCSSPYGSSRCDRARRRAAASCGRRATARRAGARVRVRVWARLRRPRGGGGGEGAGAASGAASGTSGWRCWRSGGGTLALGTMRRPAPLAELVV